MSRTCLDCPATISPKSKGRCRACNARHTHSDPDLQARRIARLKEATNAPAIRAARSELSKRVHAERSSDPEWVAHRRSLGLALCARLRADPVARANARAAQLEGFRKQSETRMGWCPVERRDEYQQLRRKVGAAEARRVIEADIPGTLEHARRSVANNNFKMDLRHLHDRIAVRECAHR